MTPARMAPALGCRPWRRHVHAWLLSLAVLSAWVLCVHTEQIRWTRTSGIHSWHVASNWHPPVVPTSEDTVVVDADGSYTVVVSQPAQAATLFLGSQHTGVQTLLSASNMTFEGPVIVGPRGRMVVGVGADATNGSLSQCREEPVFSTRLRSLSGRDVLSDGEILLGSCRLESSVRSRGRIAVDVLSSSCPVRVVVDAASLVVTNGALDWNAGNLTLSNASSLRIFAQATFNLRTNGTLESIGVPSAVDLFGSTFVTLGSSSSTLRLSSRIVLSGLLNVTRGSLAVSGNFTALRESTAVGVNAISFSGGASAVEGRFSFGGVRVDGGASVSLSAVDHPLSIQSLSVLDGSAVDIASAGFALAFGALEALGLASVSIRASVVSLDTIVVADSARGLIAATALSAGRVRLIDAGTLFNVSASTATFAFLEVIGATLLLATDLDVTTYGLFESGSIESSGSAQLRLLRAFNMTTDGQRRVSGVRVALLPGCVALVTGGAVHLVSGGTIDVAAGASLRVGVVGVPSAPVFASDGAMSSMQIAGTLWFDGSVTTMNTSVSSSGRVIFGNNTRTTFMQPTSLSGDYYAADTAVVIVQGTSFGLRADDASVALGLPRSAGTLLVRGASLASSGPLLFATITLFSESSAILNAGSVVANGTRMGLVGTATAQVAAASASFAAVSLSDTSSIQFSSALLRACDLFLSGSAVALVQSANASFDNVRLVGTSVALLRGGVATVCVALVAEDSTFELSGRSTVGYLAISGRAQTQVKAAVTVDTLALSNGALRGSFDNLTVANGNWSGGEISGIGSVIFLGTFELLDVANAQKKIARTTIFSVNGDLIIRETELTLSDASSVSVASNGRVRLIGDAAILGGSGQRGNVTVSRGGQVQAEVVPTSGASVRRRLIVIPSTGTQIYDARVGVLLVSNGTVRAAGGVSLTADALALAGGALIVDGLVNATTSMVWSAGTISGNGSIFASGAVSLDGNNLRLSSVFTLGGQAVIHAMANASLVLSSNASVVSGGRFVVDAAFTLNGTANTNTGNATDGQFGILPGASFVCADDCAFEAYGANIVNNGTIALGTHAAFRTDGYLRQRAGALLLGGTASVSAGLLVEGGMFHAAAGSRVVGPVSVSGGVFLLASTGNADAGSAASSINGNGTLASYVRESGGVTIDGSYLQRSPAILSVALSSTANASLPRSAFTQLNVTGLGVVGGYVSLSFAGAKVPLLDVQYRVGAFGGGVYGDLAIVPGQLLPPPLPSRIGNGVNVRVDIAGSERTMSLGFYRACPANCSGNGTCDVVTGECSCLPGFQGNDCSIAPFVVPTGCNVNGCGGNGVCDPYTGKCTCKTGYKGEYCSWNAIWLAIGLGLGVLFVLLFGGCMFVVLSHRKRREAKNAAVALQIDVEAEQHSTPVRPADGSVAGRAAWIDSAASVKSAKSTQSHLPIKLSAGTPSAFVPPRPAHTSHMSIPMYLDQEERGDDISEGVASVVSWEGQKPTALQHYYDERSATESARRARETGFDAPSLFGSVGDDTDNTDASVRSGAPQRTRRKMAQPAAPRDRKVPQLKARLPPTVVAVGLSDARDVQAQKRRSSGSSQSRQSGRSSSERSLAQALAADTQEQQVSQPVIPAAAIAGAIEPEKERKGRSRAMTTSERKAPVLIVNIEATSEVEKRAAEDSANTVMSLGGRSTPHEDVTMMVRIDNGPPELSANPQSSTFVPPGATDV
eukprot:Opistho-2@37703